MEAREADKLMFQDFQTNDYDLKLAKTMTGTHLEEEMCSSTVKTAIQRSKTIGGRKLAEMKNEIFEGGE